MINLLFGGSYHVSGVSSLRMVFMSGNEMEIVSSRIGSCRAMAECFRLLLTVLMDKPIRRQDQYSHGNHEHTKRVDARYP